MLREMYLRMCRTFLLLISSLLNLQNIIVLYKLNSAACASPQYSYWLCIQYTLMGQRLSHSPPHLIILAQLSKDDHHVL